MHYGMKYNVIISFDLIISSSSGGIAEEVSGNYLGCFGDDDNHPILEFAYEDETTLTPQVEPPPFPS